jgi:putative polyketide hydroxylase
VVADGTSPPPVADSYSDYVQTATPGCRAPHVWLGQADAQLSTLDLFGSAFTLLAAPEAGAWCAAAARASAAVGVRVDCYRIGAAGLNDLGGFTSAYGVQRDGAVLVRPDGHVAWRSPSAPVTGGEVENALRQILCRGGL